MKRRRQQLLYIFQSRFLKFLDLLSKNRNPNTKKLGVAESWDESCWDRYIPKLEIVNQQPDGMFEHV